GSRPDRIRRVGRSGGVGSSAAAHRGVCGRRARGANTIAIPMTFRLLAVALLAPALALAGSLAGPTEATALTPEQISQQWGASQSKYDGERQQWLARVDSGAS